MPAGSMPLSSHGICWLEEKEVAYFYGLWFVTERLRGVLGFDRFDLQRRVFVQQRQRDLDSAAFAAKSHVRNDAARRRIFREPTFPDFLHSRVVARIANIDIGFH